MIDQYLADREYAQGEKRTQAFKHALGKLGLTINDIEYKKEQSEDSTSYWMVRKTTKERVGPIVTIFTYKQSDIIRLLKENSRGIRITD